MDNIWGIIATVIIFEITKKWRNFVLFKKIPPMMITTIILITILYLFRIDYKIYNNSACFLTFLLGPATIALALPLSDNVKLLTLNKRAVYPGFIVAVFVAIIITMLLCKLFGSDLVLLKSLIPKNVTTPIAVEISRIIGGIPELTACMVVLTGLLGAVFAHKILKICRVKNDIAIGLAIGATSHVLGTSACVEKNKKKQVVMATLGLIVIGVLTTVVSLFIF